MCNPRRVKVSATRELSESWNREVARTVELDQRVVGEAVVRQAIGASLAEPVLAALDDALRAGDPEWQPVDGGFRHDVDGGYVVYSPEERALEIVARRESQVRASGDATLTLTGELHETLTAEGEGRYYDDGYGGRTEEHARREAQGDAERRIESEKRQRLDQAQRDAEAASASAVEAEAERNARQRLAREAQARRAELVAQATQQLESVGALCRQAFHRLLARGYRDAILAYARRTGAEGVQCSETDGVLQIEFHVRR